MHAHVEQINKFAINKDEYVGVLGKELTAKKLKEESLPEISDAHYVFLTRHCKRPLIFRVRVH